MPSFKLTKWSTSGKVTHHLVPRGFESSQETEGASIETYQDASSSSNAAEDFTTDDALPSFSSNSSKTISSSLEEYSARVVENFY